MNSFNVANVALNSAKNLKDDEYYTEISTIEKEMVNYEKHFKDKVIYLNCDNPKESMFFKYFKDNMVALGINQVKCSYLGGKELLVLTRDKDRLIENNLLIETDSTLVVGDFRSEYCQNEMQNSDIIITNPPFSLFREFILNLVNKDKKFIILGNINATSTKDIFPLIIAGKIWLGKSTTSGAIRFRIPQDSEIRSGRVLLDALGNKCIELSGIRWFTNLEYEHKKEQLNLVMSYEDNKELYPTYDTYNAINVSRTKDIPYDYRGLMGVPITFLDKYNPEQFEIIGIDGEVNNKKRFTIKGKKLYARIVIKRRM